VGGGRAAVVDEDEFEEEDDDDAECLETTPLGCGDRVTSKLARRDLPLV